MFLDSVLRRLKPLMNIIHAAISVTEPDFGEQTAHTGENACFRHLCRIILCRGQI